MANLIVAVATLAVLISGVSALARAWLSPAEASVRSYREAMHRQGLSARSSLDLGTRCETALGTTIQFTVENSGQTRLRNFADRENGWLGGVDGSILQTGDGDFTWIRANSPAIDCRVRDIEARLPLIWAVDDCSRVYSSIDSGQSWTASKIRFDGKLSTLAFWDEQTVWVGGGLHDRNTPVILESRDGGRTWQEVFRAEEPLGPIQDIVIAETADGAVGEGGLIVKLAPDTAS